MLLVYWQNDLEVTKYEDVDAFLSHHGTDRDYSDVHTATDLKAVDGEVQVKHFGSDELNQFAEEANNQKSDYAEHNTMWGL